MNDINISVSKEFTKFPGARYRTDGKFSGEEFYIDFLKPAIRKLWKENNAKVRVDLDGTLGYASSFISEICVRMVKDFKDKKRLKKLVIFKSTDDPLLIQAIQNFIDKADNDE